MKYKINIVDEIAIREFEDKRPNDLFMSRNFEITAPLRIIEMAQWARQLSNALLFILNEADLPDKLRLQALAALHIEEQTAVSEEAS